MPLMTLGLSHHTTPIELRERMAFAEADLPPLPPTLAALFIGGISLAAEPCGATVETLATRAARAFRLGLAGVDMLRSAHGPKILEVNSSPGFEGIEAATDRNIAELVYLEIERRVRPAPARRKKS